MDLGIKGTYERKKLKDQRNKSSISLKYLIRNNLPVARFINKDFFSIYKENTKIYFPYF